MKTIPVHFRLCSCKGRSFLLLILLLGLVRHAWTATSSVQVTTLRCEYQVNPLGIDATQPRLSWILVSAKPGERSQKQSAYRILVATSPALLNADDGDLWDTKKTESDQSIQLRYGGKTLDSRQSVWWKVQVWDQDGTTSPWSDPARWSMGLLRQSDWVGKWIGANSGEAEPEEFSGAHWLSARAAGQRPLWFRQTFEILPANPVSYGLLVAAGSGEVTVFVNGTKITPYLGKFPHGYAAQNISGMIHPGHNVIAVKLEPNSLTDSIIAGITLDMADGQIRHIQTNGQWKVSDTEKADWGKPEFNDAQWENAKVVGNLPLPDTAAERTRLPARMLRKQFRLADVPRKATVYISGLGYYELYINGRKVGKDVLAPALTEYDKRVLYVTYDVANLLHGGNNAIGILLGNGRYYAPRRYIPVLTRNFGYPKALLQLEIEYGNGKRVTVTTDGSWKATTGGPIRANNDYDGEEYDARMEQTGWSSPGFHDRTWSAAEIVDPPTGVLRAQMSDPIRVMRDVKPAKITQPMPGVYVYDMSQNMVGWARLQVSARAGTRITVRYAETLRPNGMLYTDNLRSARQTDVYILKGKGTETYEPRFTSHGFRYVEVRGFPGTPPLSALTGRVVYDAMSENADLITSSDVINHIYRNVLWGERGNYHSIPTDCPQRDERQGWLGDRSAESKGESFVFDVGQFYSQWLQDIEDTMDSEGRINDVAPSYWPFYNENVVWPASFFLVTEMLHQQYGDDQVIQKHYPAMKRWVDHMRTFIKGDLMPIDVYGDWCVPPKSLKLVQSDDPATKTAPEILGTTYFYYILHLMSRFAAISGHPEDQHVFDDQASKLKAAFNAKYFNSTTSQYDNGTQTSSVLPLALGLTPEGHRKAIYNALINKIEVDSKGHIGTGLVGSEWLMQTVAENGRPDVAYRIASQTTYPSWGYMISQGATTIWELWNGNTADPAMNSRNHLMLLGDFSTWLYEDLAGIKSDPEHPGFKHILVHPRMSEDLTFVRASHNSPYGKIATNWRREGNNFTLRVSIPLNTTATVYIPTSDPASIKENGREAGTSRGVRLGRSVPGAVTYEIGSGEYIFTSRFYPSPSGEGRGGLHQTWRN